MYVMNSRKPTIGCHRPCYNESTIFDVFINDILIYKSQSFNNGIELSW